MAGEIVFTGVEDQPENDQMTILTLRTAGDSTLYYPIFKKGRETEPTRQGMTLRAELAHTDTRAPGLFPSPCKLEFYIDNRDPDDIYIEMRYNLVSIGSLDAKITREAKQELIRLFTAVSPPLDPATLPKVKIPKGQADQISFMAIPDGTIMADFKNERDGFHRYYTRETVLRLNPLINPGTNLRIAPTDITYYVAELDESMQPTFTGEVEGGRRRRRRKTYRKRRFHTRRA